MSVFVTGTDTGVGKTSFTVWLLRRLREHGLRCAGYKPICCGDRDDAAQLLAASSAGLTIEEVNPIWLRTPAAPLTAATIEKREIDRAALREGFVRLKERFDFVAVEGVGGWMVPIAADYFTNDLAADLGLSVLIVAHNRLGCLNHILLTVQSIATAGLPPAGVVLNDFGDADNVAATTSAQVLRRCLTLPILEKFDRTSPDFAPELRQMLPKISRLLSRH
ncbi:MAG: dethiobiotin synthase [Chthoniobacterales bacterium]